MFSDFYKNKNKDTQKLMWLFPNRQHRSKFDAHWIDQRFSNLVEMGNLLRLMSHDSDGSCCGIPENVDVFVDFENAQVRLYIVIR